MKIRLDILVGGVLQQWLRWLMVKYTNPNTLIQIHKYTNTNLQIQIHKYKYKNKYTNIDILVGSVLQWLRWLVVSWQIKSFKDQVFCLLSFVFCLLSFVISITSLLSAAVAALVVSWRIKSFKDQDITI